MINFDHFIKSKQNLNNALNGNTVKKNTVSGPTSTKLIRTEENFNIYPNPHYAPNAPAVEDPSTSVPYKWNLPHNPYPENAPAQPLVGTPTSAHSSGIYPQDIVKALNPTVYKQEKKFDSVLDFMESEVDREMKKIKNKKLKKCLTCTKKTIKTIHYIIAVLAILFVIYHYFSKSEMALLIPSTNSSDTSTINHTKLAEKIAEIFYNLKSFPEPQLIRQNATVIKKKLDRRENIVVEDRLELTPEKDQPNASDQIVLLQNLSPLHLLRPEEEVEITTSLPRQETSPIPLRRLPLSPLFSTSTEIISTTSFDTKLNNSDSLRIPAKLLTQTTQSTSQENSTMKLSTPTENEPLSTLESDSNETLSNSSSFLVESPTTQTNNLETTTNYEFLSNAENKSFVSVFQSLDPPLKKLEKILPDISIPTIKLEKISPDIPIPTKELEKISPNIPIPTIAKVSIGEGEPSIRNQNTGNESVTAPAPKNKLLHKNNTNELPF